MSKIIINEQDENKRQEQIKNIKNKLREVKLCENHCYGYKSGYTSSDFPISSSWSLLKKCIYFDYKRCICKKDIHNRKCIDLIEYEDVIIKCNLFSRLFLRGNDKKIKRLKKCLYYVPKEFDITYSSLKCDFIEYVAQLRNELESFGVEWWKEIL